MRRPTERAIAAAAAADPERRPATQSHAADRPSEGAPGGNDEWRGRNARWRRLCHDLRTPLNAILGNAELLLDGSAGPLSGEARACIGDIQMAGRRMMRQVELLLELWRVRAAPAVAAALDVDLLALLCDAHAIVPGGAAPIRLASPGGRLVMRGDGRWLATLSATLIELHRDGGQSGESLLIAVESPASCGAGAALNLSWRDFQPDQVAALPLALIDAILDLHEGSSALSADGIWLYWPAARLACGTVAPG